MTTEPFSLGSASVVFYYDNEWIARTRMCQKGKMMKKVLEFAAVTAVVLMSAASVVAAELTNNDAAAHTLRITENGERSEVVVDPAQTINLCEDGCFMTAPNGDLLAIEGGETISLVEGAAIVQ